MKGECCSLEFSKCFAASRPFLISPFQSTEMSVLSGCRDKEELLFPNPILLSQEIKPFSGLHRFSDDRRNWTLSFIGFPGYRKYIMIEYHEKCERYHHFYGLLFKKFILSSLDSWLNFHVEKLDILKSIRRCQNDRNAESYKRLYSKKWIYGQKSGFLGQKNFLFESNLVPAMTGKCCPKENGYGDMGDLWSHWLGSVWPKKMGTIWV